MGIYPERFGLAGVAGWSFPHLDPHLQRYCASIGAPFLGSLNLHFFRTLPQKGHQPILFQTHSTNEMVVEGEGGMSAIIFLVPFFHHRVLRRALPHLPADGLSNLGQQALLRGLPRLFAIRPRFVRFSISGLFADTVIIIGGCQSLGVPDLAQAFLDRSASVVIGWAKMVDLPHSSRRGRQRRPWKR